MAIFCFGNPVVWFAGLAGAAACTADAVHSIITGSAGKGRLFSVLFCLTGFLAQYLPWTFVPRGTFIYHYFASVMFLILMTALVLDEIRQKWPVSGNAVCIALMIMAFVMFVILYPYVCGITVPVRWLDLGSIFAKVYY